MQKLLESVTITADDWGFSPGVNEGILDLARLGVVRNVAVTVNMPFWKQNLETLLQIPSLIFSLHLNFCFGPALSGKSSLTDSSGNFYKLSEFGLRMLAGKIRALDLEKEAQLQIQELKGAVNQNIKVINGHQHAHLVPGVMRAIEGVFVKEGVERVRLPIDSKLWATPKFPILILSQLARFRKLPAPLSWELAKYPLDSDFSNVDQLRKKLETARDMEVLVHPAKTEDFDELNVADPYKNGRRREYDCLKLLAENNL